MTLVYNEIDSISKLWSLRRILEPTYVGEADKSNLEELIPTAIRYERLESLERIFDMLGFPKDLTLKQKIALWQLTDPGKKEKK